MRKTEAATATLIFGSLMVTCSALPGLAQAATAASASASAETVSPPLPIISDSRSDANPNSAAAAAIAGAQSADALAFADHGVLRAAAFITRDTGTARAAATSSWEDTVSTSLSGFNGQHAELTFSLRVEGFLDPLGSALAEFRHELNVTGARVGLGTGTVSDRLTIVYTGANQAAGERPFINQTGTLKPGELSILPGDPVFVSAVRNLRFSFTMGDSLTIANSLLARAQELPGTFSAGSAGVNFFHTSTWMGASNLRAVDPGTGLLVDLDVANLTLSSQSGRDFRFAITPVPLPGAAGLFGLGLCALMRRRRTRQAAQSPASDA